MKKVELIQSIWRGWKMRKQLKRQIAAALAVQRVFRGFLIRSRIKRKKSLNNNEENQDERLNRLRRIRKNEIELEIIRRIPSKDYLQYSRLKKDYSARVIQRKWRKTIGSKWETNKSLQNSRYTTGFYNRNGIYIQLPSRTTNQYHADSSNISPAVETRKYQISNKMIEDINTSRLISKFSKQINDQNQNDLLGLDILYRKISDDVNKKEKDKNIEMIDKLPTLNKMKETFSEKKYQELRQLEERCSMIVEEYLMNKENNYKQKVKRNTSLEKSVKVLNELQNPMSLDEAYQLMKNENKKFYTNPSELFQSVPNLRFKSKNKDKNEGCTWLEWMNDVSIDGIQDAASAHIRAITTMIDKQRWSVVTSPYNISGPAIDVTTLLARPIPFTNSNKITTRKSLNFLYQPDELSDLEESLLWVSYASQASKYLSRDKNHDELGDNDPDLSKTEALAASGVETNEILQSNVSQSSIKNWLSIGQRKGSLSHHNAQSKLGEVVGEDLLKKLCDDLTNLNRRRDEINNLIDKEKLRKSQLIESYKTRIRNQANSQSLKNKYLGFTHSKRSLAATRIQSIVRRWLAMKKFASLFAENRVMNALRGLIKELARPELKAIPLSLLQLDPTLISHIATIQNRKVKKDVTESDILLDDEWWMKETELIQPTVQSTIATVMPTTSITQDLMLGGNKPDFPDDVQTPDRVRKVSKDTPKSRSARRSIFSNNSVQEDSVDIGESFIKSPLQSLSYLDSSVVSILNIDSFVPDQNLPIESSEYYETEKDNHPKPLNIYSMIPDQNLPVMSSRITDESSTERNPNLNENVLIFKNISIYPHSRITTEMLTDVYNRFCSDSCRTSDLVLVALKSDIRSFKKEYATRYLKSIIKLYGIKALYILIDYCSKFRLNQQTIDSSIHFLLSTPTQRELKGEISIKDFATLLGELGLEANTSQDLESDKGQENDDAIELLSRNSMFPSIEFDNVCILLRLLAGTTDGGMGSGKVKIIDFMDIIDDITLSTEKSRVSDIISAVKYIILFQSLKTSSSSSTIFQDNYAQVIKRLSKTPISYSSHFDSANNVNPVLLQNLLRRFLEAGKSYIFGSLSDLEVTEMDAILINNICSLDKSQICGVSQLQSYFCNLNSFRILQMKLETLNRAIPDILKLPKENLMSIEDFMFFASSSNIPLSHSEIFMLSQLLTRDSTVANPSINLSLLKKIYKGEFISMRLG